MTISLCMIVKDEEEVLGRCLESIADIVDEIIIADTGSTDGTVEIARRYTERVYHFPWQDDFSAARNFAFSKATKEFCMWMDADDVLEQADHDALKSFKLMLSTDIDMVMMRYHVAFNERGIPAFSYYRERIVRNDGRFRFRGRVHEAIVPDGNVVYSEIAVTHRKLRENRPGRNLHIYEVQKEAGEPFSPRDQFYYGRELYYNARYEESAEVLERFLEEHQGWVENNIEACRTLAMCRTALGKREQAARELFRSFEYDEPRAEICCDIGEYFLETERYKQAAFWYEQALMRKREDTSGAFVLPDCYGYLPCIQLCVCYDRLGDKEKARSYNERAEQLKPESEACLYNRKYFETIFPDSKKG